MRVAGARRALAEQYRNEDSHKGHLYAMLALVAGVATRAAVVHKRRAARRPQREAATAREGEGWRGRARRGRTEELRAGGSGPATRGSGSAETGQTHRGEARRPET